MPANPLACLVRRHRAACVWGGLALAVAWVGAGVATAATVPDEPLGVARDRGGRGHGSGHGGGASQPATGPFGLVWQSGTEPRGVACAAVGDIDHDKLQDFVAQDWTGVTNELLVYEDDGQGGFAEVARTAGAPAYFQVMACTTGDTDGDGLPEIIASYHGNTNVLVFEWSPVTGRYGLVNTWYDGFSGATGDLVTDLFVADTNGNGIQEIIVLAELPAPPNGTSSGTLIAIREYSGNGVTHAYRQAFRTVTGNPHAFGAALGDVDHDGNVDIVLGGYNYSWDVWRYEYDPGAATWVQKRFTCAQRVKGHSPRVVDLNHDGLEELVLISEWTWMKPKVALVVADGDDVFHVAALTTENLGWTVLEDMGAAPALPSARQPGAVAAREYNGEVTIWEVAHDLSGFTRLGDIRIAAPENWHDLEFVTGPRHRGLSLFAAGRTGVCVYRQSATDSTAGGALLTAGVGDDAGGGALRVAPNPFNPRTTIAFALAEPAGVRLAVYDIGGHLVRMLVDESLPAGDHEATWDGCDAAGRAMASGTYLARMELDGRVSVARLGLVR